MKFLDLVLTANHNLFRNKTRTLLTILAIFVGSFTIILSNAINSGVNDYIDKQVDSIGGDGFIEVVPSALYSQVEAMTTGGSKVREYNAQTGSATGAKISDQDLEEMKKVVGVNTLEVFHRLSTEWMRRKDSDKQYAVSVEYFPTTTINTDLSAGRMTDNESTAYEIIIDEDWLEPLGFSSAEDALDQNVEIAIKQTAKCYISPTDCMAIVPATIVGVRAPGILSVDGTLHISKALDNKLYELSTEGLPKESIVNYIAVGDVDPAKIKDIREAFHEIGSGYDFITVDDTVGMIRTFLDVILIVFNIFGGIALLATAIGIINTLFMSVQERTREIGLMKAMGMSSGKIFLEFSLEAILLGFWGSVVGIIASMLIGYTANDLAHASFLSDFPTFQLVVFNPINMLIITAIIMLIAFVAGTAPARRAANQNPIDSLRYE